MKKFSDYPKDLSSISLSACQIFMYNKAGYLYIVIMKFFVPDLLVPNLKSGGLLEEDSVREINTDNHSGSLCSDLTFLVRPSVAIHSNCNPTAPGAPFPLFWSAFALMHT